MNKFLVMQDILIKLIVKSDDVSILLKTEILSYLFFQLCWDFDYYTIIGDLEK